MTAPRGGLVVVVLAADEEPERRVVPIDNIRCLAKMLATSLSVPVETPTKVRGGGGGQDDRIGYVLSLAPPAERRVLLAEEPLVPDAPDCFSRQ